MDELTVEKLQKFDDNETIATGIIEDARLNNAPVRWVAVAGNGYSDWTIYYHHYTKTIDFIKQRGDKLFTHSIIKKLVPCNIEAFKMYRF